MWVGLHNLIVVLIAAIIMENTPRWMRTFHGHKHAFEISRYILFEI